MDTENTNNLTSSTSLKAIIAVLLVLLIASFIYIYKLSISVEDKQKVFKNEKTMLLKDLQMSKVSLDEAIASNTILSDELIVERDKLQKLIADIDNFKGNIAVLEKYKAEAIALRQRVNNLIKTVTSLRKENGKLVSQVDSAKRIINKAAAQNDTLISKNVFLAKKIEKASKLAIINLQTSAIKQRGSGEQTITDKASKADLLKISFMIAENKIAKTEDKTYYIQIIDTKNNVLGQKSTITFGKKELIYSFETMVKYENKTVKVEKDLAVTNIEKGTYFVTIFDKDDLVATTSFTLR